MARGQPSSFSLYLLLLLLPVSSLAFSPDDVILDALSVAGQSTPGASSPTPTPSSAAASPPLRNPIDGLVSFTGGRGNYRTMAREFLAAHNAARALVNERPMVWDKQLARTAKRWSERRRSDCAIEHSQGPYGENLFWGSGWNWRAADAVGEWVRERDHYNLTDNSCAAGRMCGHFTQIIWSSTLRVGCGRSECFNGGVIITCNYDPPGNYIGENPLTAVP
ncbi:Pathogenesis-related protein PR-1 [Apostasia shenzhenica]|uniref:Pathogenesis-related protein PR-1 n=1 Tax=Apostasia shenzhenica TaxID=1088818 RepID=A0A2I0BA75_9ASPA|nr:Pathogenesis-related protein PR-1 [Apostasia shenzhenica]